MIRGRLATAGALMLALTAASSDRLAGYTPGKAQNCISTTFAGGPDTTNDGRVIYSDVRRMWVMTPIGGCPALRENVQLIMEPLMPGQFCRNDRFRVLEFGTSIPSAYCRVGKFVPYTKVKARSD